MAQLAISPACVCSAPLGLPVVPEVYTSSTGQAPVPTSRGPSRVGVGAVGSCPEICRKHGHVYDERDARMRQNCLCLCVRQAIVQRQQNCAQAGQGKQNYQLRWVIQATPGHTVTGFDALLRQRCGGGLNALPELPVADVLARKMQRRLVRRAVCMHRNHVGKTQVGHGLESWVYSAGLEHGYSARV